MDAKTAITLQQKARKNGRRNGIAGGCPSGATNVNDMRYSCQGYMGDGRVRRRAAVSGRRRAVAGRGVAGGVFPCDPCGPCGFTHCLPCDPDCGPTPCPPGGGGVGTPGNYMGRGGTEDPRFLGPAAIAGGVFPCDPCGPCGFTHCLPCDEPCGPGACPPNGGGGGVGTPGAYTGRRRGRAVAGRRGVAGGVLPYDECGPCQLAHCIGCGVYVEGYSGGPFPPTCDCCAPCMYQSTCTPCEGPQRSQRWGNQWSPDDFGGRMCFRPCPPDPCCPEIPPPPKKPPTGKIPPGKKIHPGKKKPPKTKIPPPECPPVAACCAVIVRDRVYLKCDPATHPWNGKDVTEFSECVSTGPGAETLCSIEWIDECGTVTLVIPICYEPPPPPPPGGPDIIGIPIPKCPPGTTCCLVRVGSGSAIGDVRFVLKCEDPTHPWNGMDVTKYTKCYGANGNTICEVHWVDQCGEHWLETPLCPPVKKYSVSAVPVKPKGGGVQPATDWITARPPALPDSTAPQPSVTPKAATLAFAGGRVRTPSNGVGRR